MKRILIILAIVALLLSVLLMVRLAPWNRPPMALLNTNLATAGPSSPEVPPPLNVRRGRGQRELADPEARRALHDVGADAQAEQYWITAINNPAIPAKEREDLIEDLNEEGFANPKKPGPGDLPLILSRIALVEELQWFPMDEVNAAAFKEAHKDLVKMAERLSPK